MRRWLIFLLLALVGPLTAHAASPGSDEVAAVAGRIEAAYRDITDLQTDFTQTTHYEGFPTPSISKGRLSIRRPDQMHWDYREPSHHQIYVHGDEVLYYVPEHGQAIRSSMDREAGSTVPLTLLAGASKLTEQFALAWEGPPGAANGRYRLQLRVKGSPHMPPLTIEADAKSFLIRRVTLHDPSGAETTFEFADNTINTGLKPEAFVFTPPAGVEIVDAPPLLPPTAMPPKDELR